MSEEKRLLKIKNELLYIESLVYDVHTRNNIEQLKQPDRPEISQAPDDLGAIEKQLNHIAAALLDLRTIGEINTLPKEVIK
jgi:hypothetical protein